MTGAVQVEPLTDFLDRFAPGQRVDVDGRVLTIAAAEGAGVLLVRFREVGGRAEAERLKDAYINVSVSEARPLPKGRFYHFQLVGLEVVDAASGHSIGQVAEVLTYPANDVLRVTGGPREVLVPMVRSVVRSITPTEGRIVVQLLEDREA